MSTARKTVHEAQTGVEEPLPRMFSSSDESSDESGEDSYLSGESEIILKNVKSGGAGGIGLVSLVTQIYGEEDEDDARYNTPNEIFEDYLATRGGGGSHSDSSEESSNDDETPLGNPNALLLEQIVQRRRELGLHEESRRPDPPEGIPGVDREVVADDIAVDMNDEEALGVLDDVYIQDNPDYVLVFKHHEHEGHQNHFKNIVWSNQYDPYLVQEVDPKFKLFGGKKTLAAARAKAPEGKAAEWYDTNRRLIVGALREVGLIVRQVESADRDTIFVQIWSPLAVLETRASQKALVTGCKEGYNFRRFESKQPCYLEESQKKSLADRLYYGFKSFRKGTSKDLGDYMSEEFKSDDRWKFKPLNQAQRMMLTRDLITAPRNAGGAQIALGRLIVEGKMDSEFAMHDPNEQKRLSANWCSPRAFFKSQPLDDIRAYFGEKLGFYFAFLGFYTMFLSVPALLGLAVLIHTIVQGDTDVESTPWFIVFLMFWAVVFLEEWQRKQHRLAFRWDMDDFEAVETSRDLYVGRLACGFHTESGFIHLNAQEYEAFDVEPELIPNEKYFPSWKTAWRSTGAYFLCLVTIVALFFIYLSILYAQHLLEIEIDKSATGGDIRWGSIVGASIMGVAIAVVNQVWVRVAKALASWENHRTQSAHEQALIVKIFVVQFFNSFFALFYAAYLKRSDGILFWLYGVHDSCEDNDCMAEVANMLGSIMVTGAAINQVQETVLPWAMSFMNRRQEEKAAKALDRARTQTEQQNDLVPFESTIPEYSELVIQYGYVALFASAFPFGATLAFLNNLIEIRTDANKILNVNRRALYEGAKDIGPYYSILQIMSAAAIINNTFMVAFVSEQLDTYYGGPLTTLERWVFVVVVEHLFFIFKLMLAWHIPDVPSDVKKMRIRQGNKGFIVLEGAELRQAYGDWGHNPIASKKELAHAPRGDSVSSFDSDESSSAGSSSGSQASSEASSSDASASSSAASSSS